MKLQSGKGRRRGRVTVHKRTVIRVCGFQLTCVLKDNLRASRSKAHVRARSVAVPLYLAQQRKQRPWKCLGKGYGEREEYVNGWNKAVVCS